MIIEYSFIYSIKMNYKIFNIFLDLYRFYFLTLLCYQKIYNNSNYIIKYKKNFEHINWTLKYINNLKLLPFEEMET